MEKVILFSLLVGFFAIIVTAYDVGDPCVVEDPENHGTYAPHPTNCSQYLQCLHGFFTERSCPEGLHWSTEEVACQWPEEAGCDENITVDPPGTDDVTTDTTTSSYPPSTDDDVTTDTTTSSYPPTTDDDLTPDTTTSSYPPTTDDDLTPDTTTSSYPPTTDDDLTPDTTTSSYPPTTDDDLTTDTTRPL